MSPLELVIPNLSNLRDPKFELISLFISESSFTPNIIWSNYQMSTMTWSLISLIANNRSIWIWLEDFPTWIAISVIDTFKSLIISNSPCPSSKSVDHLIKNSYCVLDILWHPNDLNVIQLMWKSKWLLRSIPFTHGRVFNP